MVDDAAKAKARETRIKHKEAQMALFREQLEATRTAKRGLLRVMESEDASPAEILEAARLLAELGKY